MRAVSEVDFDIRRGETLGLVGESGCGKSTLGQTLIGAATAPMAATSGSNRRGAPIDVRRAGPRAKAALRTEMRMVFQDPTGSLNPRLTVRDIIGEVLEVNTRHAPERDRRRGSRSCWSRSA